MIYSLRVFVPRSYYFLHSNTSSWNCEKRNGWAEILVIKRLGGLGDELWLLYVAYRENEKW